MSRELKIDDKFVRRLMKRDVEAFHQLYSAFESPMKLVCMRYIKVGADAEDVFQEGFLKVFNNIHQLKDSKLLVGWMKRIFINASLDFLKQKQKSLDAGLDDFAEVSDRMYGEEDEYTEKEEFCGKLEEIDYDVIRKVEFTEEDLLEALSKLPDHFRVVFQLHVIDKIKHSEIADLLDIKEKTSKTRLLRARGLLKKEMQLMAMEKLVNG